MLAPCKRRLKRLRKGLHRARNGKGSATLLQNDAGISSNDMLSHTIWDRIFRVQESLKSFWLLRLSEHVTNHAQLFDCFNISLSNALLTTNQPQIDRPLQGASHYQSRNDSYSLSQAKQIHGES